MPPKTLLISLIVSHTVLGGVVLLVGVLRADVNAALPPGVFQIIAGIGMIAFGAGIGVAGAMWSLEWGVFRADVDAAVNTELDARRDTDAS